jgi:2'-5' RNA ligase
MADLRLFFAVRIPEALNRGIDELSSSLRGRGDGVKWVSAQNIHVTLKFLGAVDEHLVGRLSDAVRPAIAGLGEIRLSAGDTGMFPDNRRPKVIWVGLSGDIDLLAAAHDALEGACESLGFPREGRKFSPHLTIGRVRERLSLETLKKIEMNNRVVIGDMVANEIELIKSDLFPSGPVYTTLDRFSLI